MPQTFTSEANRILALFYDGQILSQDDLRLALQEVVALNTGAYDELFDRILTTGPENSKQLLELLLSSSECGDSLGKWLMESLPSQGEHFNALDIAVKVFVKLSLSIPFIYSFERKVNTELSKHRVKIEHSPLVIEAFIRFLATSPALDEPEGQNLREDIEFRIRTTQSQRQRRGAQMRPPTIFDAKLTKSCKILSVSIPTCPEDARRDLRNLVQDLYDIFLDYLKLLRKPAVEASLRQSFLYMPPVEEPEQTSEDKTGTSGNEASTAQDELANVPAAFPMVQPMKAALYFESADGFGEWRILISTRADRDLRDTRRRDKKFFTIIVKKIKELSNGHFSDDNQKRLTGTDTEVPIYEAKMTRDSRLVYHIDCVPEYDTEIERQVIKIFGIYTHAQINKHLWNSVSWQLGKKGNEYKRRCKHRNRPSLAGDKVFAPACFPPNEAEEKEERFVPEIPAESLEEIHSLLVLEKFVPFSQALLNSIIADLDVAHVFDVSPQEMEIIQYPYSCYVLGRSGTGKTTTMLFKMLGIQRAYERRQDVMAKPRQVFVTQSRVLAGKVEEYFSKLLDSLATGNKTKEELAHMIKSKQQQQDEELVDVDDEQNWRADLPAKFSELRDEHFPLFLTFDRLAALLENDFQVLLDHSILSPTGVPLSPVVDTTPNASHEKGQLISYDTFLAAHWPHFSQNLKKGLDPALVYSELMGVIQGSEESLYHESRYLDEASYKTLSHRTQYAFATRRDTIYSIFQLYLKQKKQAHSYDSADRTHNILKAIYTTGVPGQKLDFLYVDEAQDNLLIDALLLRSLVKNPNGLFWAGDTAQTISVGSSFRFNDLKAFLYRLEQRREESGPALTEAPRTFQLAVNYRSHGGIVKCAHSVIELITKFWPYAIDVLSREQGVVDGSKPVFFSGWDSETVRYEQFLFGETGNPIEFGAQQCILVRNEAAREELRQQVGEIGLILTLYESKGLEFDDVLLYKFFEDSTVDISQWRVVLNLLGDAARNGSVGSSAPTFDEVRHAGVCSELKFLYVAVTRARKNLWIVDCSDKSEPMRTFWTTREEIQNCTPGTDVPRLAVSSTPEEWAKTGKSLFSNKRYAQAMHCYERAGLVREAAVAHTYYLRDQARRIVLNGSKQMISQRHAAFLAAALSFLECAAASLSFKEKVAYFRNAGSCFEEAQHDFRAAEAFKNAQDFTKAAKLYRKCAKFDEAVAIVTEHRDAVEGSVVHNIIDIARLFYFRGGELEKATQLFNSVDEQLEYLEDFDLDISRAALLEKLGKFQEAAEIHLSEGRTLEAIRLFFKDTNDPAAIVRGQKCIIQGLWEQVSYGAKLGERHEDIEKLLKLASATKSDDTSKVSSIADQISMFNSIKSRDLHHLRALGRKFDTQGNATSSLLCFDFAFRSVPSMYRMSQVEISGLLQDYLIFCKLLFNMTRRPNLVQDEQIRRLFRIQTTDKNSYHLPNNTFLHGKMLDSRAVVEAVTEYGLQVAEWELTRKLKAALLERLVTHLKAQIEECKYAQAFTPCHSFLISNGQCNRRDCPHLHLKASSLTQPWFVLQIRIHLQQILLLQGLSMVAINPTERITYYRHWVGRLFNTLHPAIFRLGNFANSDPSTIPEWPKAMGILRTIFGNLLFWTGYSPRDTRLLTTGYQIIRIAFYYDKDNAHSAILRSPLTNVMRSSPDYLRTAGDLSTVILPELSCLLLGSHPSGTSFGILSVRHILDKNIPIEATVLYDLIDTVTGSIILLRQNGYLHNTSLPLSWLNHLLRVAKLNFSMKPAMPYNAQLKSLVFNLIRLLDRFVDRHQLLDHIKVGTSDLLNLPGQRSIYISRLCRVICLVGLNVNNEPLRAQILISMRRLGQTTTHYNFRDYASAVHWNDLARAVQKSVADSPLDEMIQLYHSSKVINSRPPPRGVRRVLYNNVADVPRLLDGSLVFSNLRANAPAFIPKPRAIEESGTAGEEEADQDAEEPEVDNTDIVNTTAPVEVTSVGKVPSQDQASTETLTKAATVCQRSYRKSQRYSRKKNMTSLDVSRQTNFMDCLKFSEKHKFPERCVYRLLFLGPLPHILLCLSAVHSWVMANKQRNKGRFLSAEHQELEDLNKRLTEQKKVVDEIRRLQKALSPQSELHSKRDIEQLKTLVLQVEELINRVAPSVARDVNEDLDLGRKGIVEVKKPRKPKPKPTLIIDDGFGDDYHSDYYEDVRAEGGVLEVSTHHDQLSEARGSEVPEVVMLNKAQAPIIKDDPVSAILHQQESEEQESEGADEESSEANSSEGTSGRGSDEVTGDENGDEDEDEDEQYEQFGTPECADMQSRRWYAVSPVVHEGESDEAESASGSGGEGEAGRMPNWGFI